MICSWCGSPFGVRVAETHVQRPASVCGERSPFDPRLTCVLERGHFSACRTESPLRPTPLCYRCFGVYRETGERPAGLQSGPPRLGPERERVVDLSRLR